MEGVGRARPLTGSCPVEACLVARCPSLRDMGRICPYPMLVGRWLPQSLWRWGVEEEGPHCWRGARTGVNTSLALPLVSQLGLEVPLHQGPQEQARSPAAPSLLTPPHPQLTSSCPGTAQPPVPDPALGPAMPGGE